MVYLKLFEKYSREDPFNPEYYLEDYCMNDEYEINVKNSHEVEIVDIQQMK